MYTIQVKNKFLNVFLLFVQKNAQIPVELSLSKRSRNTFQYRKHICSFLSAIVMDVQPTIYF